MSIHAFSSFSFSSPKDEKSKKKKHSIIAEQSPEISFQKNVYENKNERDIVISRSE
jgi:hypothetical protein